MARPKRARKCKKKGAADGADGDTVPVPDEKMVGDEVPENDDLAAAASTSTTRSRMSTALEDVVGADDEDESDEDKVELDAAMCGEDESNAVARTHPRRRIMSEKNMLIKAQKDAATKKAALAPLFDHRTQAPSVEACAEARLMKARSLTAQ
jgi:hypothetical protein